MIGWLITQQWREATRASVWQKNLVINIVLGLLMLYLLLNMLVLGFFADKILEELFPGEDVLWLFNGIFGFYLVVDLVMRFMLQELPVLAVQPYLHLPVRRSRLVHFLLGKSLFSFFNMLPLLVLVPFALKVVAPELGGAAAGAWLLSFFTLMLVNNYLVVYLKRQLSLKPAVVLGFALLLGLLLWLDFSGIFSLREAAAGNMAQVLAQPWLAPLPVLLLVAVYLLNFRLLRAQLYPAEQEVKRAAGGKELAFLSRFGETGDLIALELKLIWRNKRPKSVLLMSSGFLFYGFIFYGNDTYMDGFAMLFFPGIIITGMFLLNYGQFMYSWEGAYFDALHANRLSPLQYFKAKYSLFVATCTIAYLLALPYGLLNLKIVAVNTTMFLLNISINTFIVMYMAGFGPKRIDLSKSTAFNWQGVGASQFILVIPIIALPFLLYLPFGLLNEPYLGLAFIAGLSLLNLLFVPFWLRKMAEWHGGRKYKMLAAFRES